MPRTLTSMAVCALSGTPVRATGRDGTVMLRAHLLYGPLVDCDGYTPAAWPVHTLLCFPARLPSDAPFIPWLMAVMVTRVPCLASRGCSLARRLHAGYSLPRVLPLAAPPEAGVWQLLEQHAGRLDELEAALGMTPPPPVQQRPSCVTPASHLAAEPGLQRADFSPPPKRLCAEDGLGGRVLPGGR